MFIKKPVFLMLCSCVAASSIAQAILPVPRNIQDTYIKNTRSIDGKPGKNYWQNTADYSINVYFDPDTRILNGTVNIVYTNNSPDTLSTFWFKLYPNMYKKGISRSQTIDAADLSDGIRINSISINGTLKDTGQIEVDGTNMTINTDKVLPHKMIEFVITYDYTLNKRSHIRTGEIEPGADFVAYFFPRIAVYDDIDGWNKIPYKGKEEFYNDFCNFKANITVPKNYVVWATGNLLNCDEVLNPTYCQRIHDAEQNDSITTIIDITDLQAHNITRDNANTWKFEANNVTDFAFATSNHYVWKSSSLVVDQTTKRRTRTDAVFNPLHKDYYRVIDYARAAVQHMSFDFVKWPYPYPHITVFDGLDQMEYPMMVNDNPLEQTDEEIELTDHEIFHTMFPFYMGINETKYAWMDEGWATIGEWLISPMIDSSIEDDYGVARYEKTAGNEVDLPIKTLSMQQSDESYFLNSYPKPAFGYLYVRDMLGDEIFTKSLHHYIEQWQGKHPMPYDFFNCMNEGSGRNLNWFWKRWFFDDGVPDLAISSVANTGKNYTVTIALKGNKPVPVNLTIYFDNEIQKIHRSIEIWEKENTTVLTFETNKKVKKMVLGSLYGPDINKKDNVYKIK